MTLLLAQLCHDAEHSFWDTSEKIPHYPLPLEWRIQGSGNMGIDDFKTGRQLR